MKKKKSFDQLKKDADAAFSNYIRERDLYTCITCGKFGGKSEIDCGHFVKRGDLLLRFNEINCNAQCKRCNHYLKGNDRVYSLKLEEKYGHGILQELERIHLEYKAKSPQLRRSDYEALIEEYKSKLSNL